jgi:hypothetical protein
MTKDGISDLDWCTFEKQFNISRNDVVKVNFTRSGPREPWVAFVKQKQYAAYMKLENDDSADYYEKASYVYVGEYDMVAGKYKIIEWKRIKKINPKNIGWRRTRPETPTSSGSSCCAF